MIKIPSQNKWIQANRGDMFGSIWSSFNIDLTLNISKLRTNRMLTVARGVDDSTTTYVNGIGLSAAFAIYDGKHWAATTGTISRAGTPRTAVWSLDTTTDKPTTCSNRYSDIEIFNEIMYVSLAGTNLSKNDGGTWGTVAITGGISNVAHMMTSYAKRLYVVADEAKINSMDIAESFGATIGTSSNTLDLTNPSSNTITFLKATSSRVWIGTVNTLGGRGHIYAWDGEQTSVNEAYDLESSGAMAAVVKDDVLYVVDNDGRLMAFNGGAFIEIDRFPIKQGEYLFGPLLDDNERWIHPNGITLQDDRILILIDNEYRGSSATSEERVSSGIWEYTPETGLYHKYALSALNATSGTQLDYGQNRVSRVGALEAIKSSSTSAADNGALFAGIELFTDDTGKEIHIQIDDLNDTTQKYGYIVTPKIYTKSFTSLEDSWQKVFIRHKKLINSSDKIIVKYRVEEQDADVATITWVDTDTFTVTAADVTSLAIGDEVEVIQGDGSGKCAHVASFTGTTTLTVNLDDTFTGVTTNTAKARFQKWIKCGEGTDQTVKFHEFPIGDNDTWVQLKICMQFTNANEVDDLLLINETNHEAA